MHLSNSLIIELKQLQIIEEISKVEEIAVNISKITVNGEVTWKALMISPLRERQSQMHLCVMDGAFDVMGHKVTSPVIVECVKMLQPSESILSRRISFAFQRRLLSK